MRPAAGAHWTCTSHTARKMVIRRPITESNISSSTSTTWPSAGETINCWSVGILRFGLRKKEKSQKNQDPARPFPSRKKAQRAHDQRRQRKFVRVLYHEFEIKSLCHRELDCRQKIGPVRAGQNQIGDTLTLYDRSTGGRGPYRTFQWSPKPC